MLLHLMRWCPSSTTAKNPNSLRQSKYKYLFSFLSDCLCIPASTSLYPHRLSSLRPACLYLHSTSTCLLYLPHPPYLSFNTSLCFCLHITRCFALSSLHFLSLTSPLLLPSPTLPTSSLSLAASLSFLPFSLLYLQSLAPSLSFLLSHSPSLQFQLLPHFFPLHLLPGRFLSNELLSEGSVVARLWE